MTPYENFLKGKTKVEEEAFNALISIIKGESDKIQMSIKYGLPFFDYYTGLCYLNGKAKGIDLGFMKGKLLQESFPELNGEKRKQTASLFIEYYEDWDVELIRKLIVAAMKLNESSARNFK